MTFHLSYNICLGVLLTTGACAQATDEYRVKAAFLYNFAKFVDWPPQTFKTPSQPIVIGILGKDPFGDALITAIAGKTLEGRPFEVRAVGDPQQASACHILFVSSSEKKRLAPLFTQLGDRAILTVGESDNFTAEGGIVNFKIEGGTVRFQINIEAARKQQLRISAKLLNLAEIVGK